MIVVRDTQPGMLKGPTGRELIDDTGRYRDRLCRALERLDLDAVDLLAGRIVEATLAGHRVFLVGNGGSASTAAHYACDLTLGFQGQGVRAAIRNLAESASVLTALANDHGFDDVFQRQLQIEATAGDMLVAISVSGESENVLRAARTARKSRLMVAGVTGFEGGGLRPLADFEVNVAERHYGIVEDVHLSVGHMLSQAVTLALMRRSTANQTVQA